jgi:agmatine deiminase
MTHPDPTPAVLGYRWPAEWETHAATWLSWPHNVDTWPGIFAGIPGQFATFVRTIAEFEPVQILAGGEGVLADAKAHVGQLSNVTVHDIPTNDAWCRDHGPTFLVQSSEMLTQGDQKAEKLALIDWQYNAWGGKYPPFDHDNAVPARIARRLDCHRFAVDVVLEGGAIEGNGQGTVLTTPTCLLNPNRNPSLNRQDFQLLLRDYLAAKQVIWLERGELAGDDTDGHIDQLARFVGPKTVVAAMASDTSDINDPPLRENLAQLQSMTDQDGAALDVVPLPLPPAKFHNGQRLPASYCNFYIVNGGVILPQFDDPADARAVDIIRELLPDRTVIGLPAIEMVWGLGAFHCLSQQQPSHVDTINGEP